MTKTADGKYVFHGFSTANPKDMKKIEEIVKEKNIVVKE